MKPLFRNLMAGLASATVLLLAACGGGGGGDDDTATSVTRPTAVATADSASVPIGTTVTLDGSASSTTNSGSLSYAWTLASRPDGSATELSSASAAQPTFTPDVAGQYVADLVVSDGTASSTSARVTIAATNPNPVAVVTPQTQSILRGLTATLDGSSSLPPTGVATSELSYQWTLTEQPEGDTTTLDNASSAQATFLASTLGVYRATLVVSHGDKTSATVEAVVNVNNGNSSPVISLNVPSTVVRGETVTLDGSASSDPDAGDTLHYRWFFPTYDKTPPYGNTATISNHTSALASFVPNAVGTYYVDFTVYDGSVATTQQVSIVVTKPEGAENTAPVAVIGLGTGYSECETAASSCGIGANRSYDIDGDARTYKWSWTDADGVAQTATTGSSTSSSSVQFGTSAGSQSLVGTANTSYQITMIANDGSVDSAPVTHTLAIKNGANAYPVAKVTASTSKVLVTETITFDASASSDANDDQMFYHWTLADRPDNSTATLQNAGTSSTAPYVVADQPGIYTVSLSLTDSNGAASSASNNSIASVFAKARNNAPTVASLTLNGVGADALQEQPLVFNTSGTAYPSLLATFIDPDNDTPLEYVFTVTKQPSGSAIADITGNAGLANGVQTAAADITTKTEGDYEFEVIVSDGVDRASKSIAGAVVSRASYPSLLLEQYGLQHRRFPYVYSLVNQTLTRSSSEPVLDTYTLTAGDQSYTIADLQTTSVVSGYVPAFNGLQNGQVIAKGETVTFTITRPLIADENALATSLRNIRLQYGTSSTEYKTEAASQQKLLADYQFKWSFRAQERDGYTFSYSLD